MCSFCQGQLLSRFCPTTSESSLVDWLVGCFWAATTLLKKRGPKETQQLNTSFREKMANECLLMIFFWKALFLTINKNNFPKKITHKTWKQPKNKTHIIWVKSSSYPKSWFFQKKMFGCKNTSRILNHQHFGWRQTFAQPGDTTSIEGWSTAQSQLLGEDLALWLIEDVKFERRFMVNMI